MKRKQMKLPRLKLRVRKRKERRSEGNQRVKKIIFFERGPIKVIFSQIKKTLKRRMLMKLGKIWRIKRKKEKQKKYHQSKP